MKCFCGAKTLDVEHATYVIDGTPACSTVCFDEMLAAHHPQVKPVMVTFRREGDYLAAQRPVVEPALV